MQACNFNVDEGLLVIPLPVARLIDDTTQAKQMLEAVDILPPLPFPRAWGIV
jgi:hypothetical protein